MLYVLSRSGNKPNLILSAAEIIENAKEQKRAGIVPRYVLRIYKDGKSDTTGARGFLVASTFGGCIVCTETKPNEWHIKQGMQGDFACVMS